MLYLDAQQPQRDVQAVRLALGLHEHDGALAERAAHQRRQQRLAVTLALAPDPDTHGVY